MRGVDLYAGLHTVSTVLSSFVNSTRAYDTQYVLIRINTYFKNWSILWYVVMDLIYGGCQRVLPTNNALRAMTKGMCMHVKRLRCWVWPNNEPWPPQCLTCRDTRPPAAVVCEVTQRSPRTRQLSSPINRSAWDVWPADVIGIQAVSEPGQTAAQKLSTYRRQAAWCAHTELSLQSPHHDCNN